jgi:hypothetical protein
MESHESRSWQFHVTDDEFVRFSRRAIHSDISSSTLLCWTNSIKAGIRRFVSCGVHRSPPLTHYPSHPHPVFWSPTPAVTLCTAKFNIQKFCVLPTQFIVVLCVVPGFRMSGAVPPVSLCAFIAYTKTTLHLFQFWLRSVSISGHLSWKPPVLLRAFWASFVKRLLAKNV